MESACPCSLSLRERAGVREATQRRPWHIEGCAPSWPMYALAASLTPALSRREKEQNSAF